MITLILLDQSQVVIGTKFEFYINILKADIYFTINN